jgi:monovalent cation/hydrogen antiporter
MTDIAVVLGLLMLVTALAVYADRLKVPYPILLVLMGLGIGFVPGLPAVNLSPDIVLLVFLPPILYSAAWYTTWTEFKQSAEPISVLALGLVLATTLVVAWAAHSVVPGMGWAAAFTLGAIVSPPDAVAATAVAKQLNLPRKLVTVLEGESLVNDSTGLIAYRFGVAAVVTGAFSLAEASLRFVVVAAGGVAIGLLIGWLAVQVHRRVKVEPAIETMITILTPFAAYLPAEYFHVSGVLGVVTAGLYVGKSAPELHSPQMRMHAVAVWDMLIFSLNSLIFILIGLQLPQIMAAISGQSLGKLLTEAAVVSGAAILARLLFIYAADLLSGRVRRALGRRPVFPSLKFATVLGWTGMRGVVSLAAALALPLTTASGAPFPHRNEILFLTFSVILATLVLQGLTLPALIRRLRFAADTSHHDQEHLARQAALEAAQAHLESEFATQPDLPPAVVAHLRQTYQGRTKHLHERHHLAQNPDSETAVFLRLSRQALAVERRTVVGLRNQGLVNDEVLHAIERDLDLEEARLGK